jgi:arylsulfatase A-like enzyme
MHSGTRRRNTARRLGGSVLVGLIAAGGAGCDSEVAEEVASPAPSDSASRPTLDEQPSSAPAAALAERTPQDEAHVKNVLLFVVDTLRADHLGAYGYERDTSPNVDAFAKEATLWLDNRCQSNWTNPSMVSLMTGLWVTRDEQVLPKSHPTLAELFQESGFATVAFVANRTLTTGRGFQRGFDDFHYLNLPGKWVAEQFTNWLDERNAANDERGFFAWVHLIDPHTPYEPLQRHDVFEGPRPGQSEFMRRWAREAKSILGVDEPRSTKAFREAVRTMQTDTNLYDGEVHQADAAFGRVIDHLRRNDLLDETLIVFAADHGELLYEYLRYPQEREARRDSNAKRGRPFGIDDHFAYGHAAWYQPELWNTPLIVRGPGFAPGERRSGLSGNIDIFPTVLAAAGLEFEGDRPGLDLRVADLAQRSHVFAHGFETSTVLEVGGLQLVDSRPKRFLLPESAPNVLELWDLTSGAELLPLQEARPTDVARLHDVLVDWRKRWHRNDAILELDTPEALEALRELGYLEDQ